MKKILTIDKCSILNFMHIDCFYLLQVLGYYVITTICVEIEFENAKHKHPGSFAYFKKLVKSGAIGRYPLEIEDLVEMSNVPQSKRASDAELSCFIVAKRIDGKVMTDDQKAINYIPQYIQISPKSIIRLIDILIDAYLANYLGDHELRSIQKTLAENKFTIPIDLASEAARRKWMIGKCS